MSHDFMYEPKIPLRWVVIRHKGQVRREVLEYWDESLGWVAVPEVEEEGSEP